MGGSAARLLRRSRRMDAAKVRDGAVSEALGYRLSNAPSHMTARRRWDDLADLLLDPQFLQDKLHAFGIARVLADFALIGSATFASRDAVLTVEAALRLSAAVLD